MSDRMQAMCSSRTRTAGLQDLHHVWQAMKQYHKHIARSLVLGISALTLTYKLVVFVTCQIHLKLCRQGHRVNLGHECCWHSQQTALDGGRDHLLGTLQALQQQVVSSKYGSAVDDA